MFVFHNPFKERYLGIECEQFGDKIVVNFKSVPMDFYKGRVDLNPYGTRYYVIPVELVYPNRDISPTEPNLVKEERRKKISGFSESSTKSLMAFVIRILFNKQDRRIDGNDYFIHVDNKKALIMMKKKGFIQRRRAIVKKLHTIVTLEEI